MDKSKGTLGGEVEMLFAIYALDKEDSIQYSTDIANLILSEIKEYVI